jgi:hypothetical protein
MRRCRRPAWETALANLAVYGANASVGDSEEVGKGGVLDYNII